MLTQHGRGRKRAFDALGAKARKVHPHNVEVGSVSDLLSIMVTPAAKRFKPTIREKLRGWAGRFRWPARSWAQTTRLSSNTEGGRQGYAASKGALDNTHRHLPEQVSVFDTYSFCK